MSLKGQLEQQGLIVDGTPTQLRSFAANGNLIKPSPNSGFWKGCPTSYYADPAVSAMFFDDFYSIALDDTTLKPTQYIGAFDANGAIGCSAADVGGALVLSTHTDANDGVSCTFGSPSVIRRTGKKMWAEFRVKANAHANIAGAFIGLAGATTYDFDTLTDTTGVLAETRELIGFRILAATPAAWQACWKTDGQTVGSVAACANADDYHTFGIYYDGVTTVSFYVDRVLLGTSVETDATAFATGGYFVPFACIKTVTAAKSLYIDWIKCVNQR